MNGINALMRRYRDQDSPLLPREDIARRQQSTNQDASSHQTANLLVS